MSLCLYEDCFWEENEEVGEVMKGAEEKRRENRIRNEKRE